MLKNFNITVISKACGVLPHTLRAWETRYNMFTPKRDPAGKRIYSEDDLKKAISLAKLVKHGHSISSLAKYTLLELENLERSVSNELDPHLRLNSSEIGSKKLMTYLDSYKIELVSNELQYLRQSMGVKEFILKTILPMMRDIGVKVEQGKYTVTQEHIMSTIVRDQLSQIDLPNLNTKSSEIAIATPEGNLHELAIIIANILCRSHKFTTRYLGAAHPADCLAEAINILKTPILILGTVTSDSWDYSKKMIPYLADIDRYLTQDLDVFLGGGSPLNFPGFENIKSVTLLPTFEDLEDKLTQIY